MLLAIDIGNTQTVIGLFGDDEADDANVGPRRAAPAEAGLLDHWRIATNAERTSDEHALVVQEFLGFHGFSFDDDIDGIAISSVVPRTTAAFREMTEKYFGFRPGRDRARREDRPADPHREPARGRRRPHRQRRRRARPATAARRSSSTSAPPPPSTRSRPRASTSAAPSPPASRSASTPSTPAPPRSAASSWSSPAT